MYSERLSNLIAALLESYDINEVVGSPGTRDVPLLAAIAARKNLRLTMVTDERAASFVAFGKALISGKAVAVVCTSGSAVLNLAPGLAEAYYSHVPIIAITADRPANLIDRNDGQTIRQLESLRSVTKGCYQVHSSVDPNISELIINDALAEALKPAAGPVQINVAISNPRVAGDGYMNITPRRISQIVREGLLSTTAMRELASKLQSPCRVMIVAGAYVPNQQLNRSLSKLARFENFIVIVEATSNLHGENFITDVDSLIKYSDTDDLIPDVIITFGAPILSNRLRKFVVEHRIEHWHVGISSLAVDTFNTLKLRIDTEPSTFFRQLAASLRRTVVNSDYSRRVAMLYRDARKIVGEKLDSESWCELTALKIIFASLPSRANLQLSNGMTVRYAQRFNLSRFHRIDCNRGVSGIDGSTATAVGASSMYADMTVLVSGDMSARYDIGSLGLNCITPRFKMIVMCNGGGQIFKVIPATAKFTNVDGCLSRMDSFPVEDIGRAWGYNVFRATSPSELKSALPLFLAEHEKPALLAVYTDCNTDVEINSNF